MDDVHKRDPCRFFMPAGQRVHIAIKTATVYIPLRTVALSSLRVGTAQTVKEGSSHADCFDPYAHCGLGSVADV